MVPHSAHLDKLATSQITPLIGSRLWQGRAGGPAAAASASRSPQPAAALNDVTETAEVGIVGRRSWSGRIVVSQGPNAGKDATG